MAISFRATSLQDIAKYFVKLAEDAENKLSSQSTIRTKEHTKGMAYAFRMCADVLEKCELKPPHSEVD